MRSRTSLRKRARRSVGATAPSIPSTWPLMGEGCPSLFFSRVSSLNVALRSRHRSPAPSPVPSPARPQPHHRHTRSRSACTRSHTRRAPDRQSCEIVRSRSRLRTMRAMRYPTPAPAGPSLALSGRQRMRTSPTLVRSQGARPVRGFASTFAGSGSAVMRSAMNETIRRLVSEPSCSRSFVARVARTMRVGLSGAVPPACGRAWPRPSARRSRRSGPA